jgi:hypothetical protein
MEDQSLFIGEQFLECPSVEVFDKICFIVELAHELVPDDFVLLISNLVES